MRFSLKGLLFNLLLVLTSIAVALFLLELAVKVFYPQSHYAITSAPWGFRHIPNASISYYGERGEIGRPRGLVPIHYNSKGLREDNEYSYEKPAGIFRILILGDSWAEDMGSYLENLHSKRLEKKLNSMGSPLKFEVINAGHYAFDNAQELIFFDLEGKRYKPDLVFVFYSGDTADPKYASIENGALKLHLQTYTFWQKVRRSVISFLRQHSDLGTLVLDRMTGSEFLSRLMLRFGLKEKNVYATFPKDHPAVSAISDKAVADQVVYSENGSDFKYIDKQIYLELKKKVEEGGGKLIFMGVTNIDPSRVKWLEENGFLVMKTDIDLKQMGRDREEDIRTGKYDEALDSHRFGYKRNEIVAQKMLDFIRNHDLLPK